MPSSKEIVDEIVEIAAKEAKITREQSRCNLQAAFKTIQKYTMEREYFDLTALGIVVYSRSFNSPFPFEHRDG